jgi:DNA-damage-inducible protein D
MASQKAKTGLNTLINSDAVRRVDHERRTLYAAVDVVRLLAETHHAEQYWTDLKLREPVLENLVELADFTHPEGDATEEALDLGGVLRLVQSIPSAKAERFKQWLIRNARQRLQEAANPELAVIRTQKLYERKGYSRRWVDKRMRGVSARQELTGEWFKRGAAESDQYRELTNEMTRAAFGMDVEGYRHFKNLTRTRENLRDHMTDLELALTTLAETVAVNLHRTRESAGLEALTRDVKDAGKIASSTLQAIETQSGQPVLAPGDARPWRTPWGRMNSDRAVA